MTQRIKVKARKQITIGILPNFIYSYKFEDGEIGYLPDSPEGRGYAEHGQFDILGIEEGEPYSISRMKQLGISPTNISKDLFEIKSGTDQLAEEKFDFEEESEFNETKAKLYSMTRLELLNFAENEHKTKLSPTLNKDELISRLTLLEHENRKINQQV